MIKFSPIYELKGHTRPVTTIAVSSDSKYILSGSNDKSMILWDLNTGDAIRQFNGHEAIINSVAISSDITFVASASEDKTIKIWDINSGSIVHSLEAHKKGVRYIALSPDNKYLVSSSYDKTSKIWNPKRGILLSNLTYDKGRAHPISISPDSRYLVYVSNGKLFRKYEFETEITSGNFSGHKDLITSIAHTPTGKEIITCSGDKTIKIWDSETSRLIITIETKFYELSSLSVSPSGKYFICISGTLGDYTIRIYETLTGKEARLMKRLGFLKSAVITPDGKFIVVASTGNNVKVFDFIEGKQELSKKRLDETTEKEIIQKIKLMMQVSTRINLDRMQNVLDLPQKLFDNKIFEWARDFGFTIDGDDMVINQESVSDFIQYLDTQFQLWEEAEKEGTDKLL